VLLLATLAAGSWLWLEQEREEVLLRELEDGLAAALADGCAAPDDLAALEDRLSALDPAQARYTDLWRRLRAEQARCAAASELADALQRAEGDCPALYRLDGRLAEEDAGQPALAPVRDALDRELALCALADDYARRLSEARADCAALRALDADMRTEDASRQPLLAVRERLDELLAQCRSLDELGQALEEAGADCAKLTLVEQRLEREGPRNPYFLQVRKTLLGELELCRLAAAMEQDLAAAAPDCDALAALEPRLASSPAGDPRFRSLRARLAQALRECSLARTLDRKLADAGSDCGMLAALRSEMDAVPREMPARGELERRFDALWSACERGPVTAAKVDKMPVRPDRRRGPGEPGIGCPGKRPVEEAPDLVLVFDASASMDRPISEHGAVDLVRQGLQMGGLAGAALGVLMDQAVQGAGGARRIQVAKEATGRIVQSLPDDVDVGLVLVEDCPSARAVGFFPPAERGRLMGGINRIRPVSGTPLASGILRAADMVDGVRAPAVMVILSDGKESCDQDPCVAAHQVARRKPRLTINVVDITGTGAGNCAARATGGKVYTAKNAAEIRSMMQSATQEVRGPAECRQ
jgi:hypothetical protein